MSGPGMSRIHRHRTGAELAAEDIVRRMRRGDSSCAGTFGIWMDCVASCLASMVLHINPGIIVIGGGLSGIDEIYQRLPEVLSDHLLSGIEPPVIAPGQHGGGGAVRGAAIAGAQNCHRTGA